MNCHINFHQLDATDAIKNVVNKKSKKLEKFFSRDVDVEWFLEANKEGHHARALLSGDGLHINADSKTNDLYKAIDETLQKMETQVKKHKEKQNDRHSDPEFMRAESLL